MQRRSSILATAAFMILASTPRAASHPLPADRKSYKTNADGLRKLIQDLTESAKRGDLTPFSELAIPDRAEWFRNVFGESVSAILSPIYEADKATMAETLATALREAQRKGKLNVHVNHFRLGGTSQAVVSAMTNPTEIFSVVLNAEREDSRANLGFFTVVDDAFRYVGRMYVVISPDVTVVSENSALRLLLVNATDVVQEPWLVEQPPPRYPPDLRQRGIQGTGKVSGFVAEDGTVANLTVVGGPLLFAQATLDAVRRWRYKPLLLNGTYLRALVFVEITYSLRPRSQIPD